MPTHKGVRISIISQWELSIHPEFAHPESSQFKRSPNLSQRESLPPAPEVASESKADRLLGRQSAISVYIPSVSGTRFWLRYSVLEPEKTVCHLWYFKFFINGSHITSWGINTKTTSSGQVMRALFDPSDRWNYKENGILFKNNGTEARPFFFNNEAEARTAASDGGLLEVFVFRAKGRKRRFVAPEEFRKQERYGITMPSGGLLDKPQDAKYYDYLLMDPKDNPYATFRFHYRSWDHLESLQLVPVGHPRALIPATPSLLSLNGQSRKLQEEQEQDWETVADVISPSKLSPSSVKSSPSHTPWLTDIFDNSKLADANVEKVLKSAELLESSPPPNEEPQQQLSISRIYEAGNNRSLIQLQNARNWAQSLDRPLPEIPTRRSSLRDSRSLTSSPSITHSRKSSAASHAPSISPSLRSYADRDTSSSPEPVIGVAAVVPVLAPCFGDESVTGTPKSFQGPESDIDPFTEPSLAHNAFGNRRAIASPTEGLILPPNVTIRKHRRASKTLMSPFKSILHHDDDDNSTTLSLTESEWMCRTPSPVREDPSHARFSRLWSPGTVDKHKSPSQGNISPKRALNWFAETNSPVQDASENNPLAEFRFNNNEVKIRSGNWI